MTTITGPLPRSSFVLRAFRGWIEPQHPGQVVLDAAAELAECHSRRQAASDAGREADASERHIAASMRMVSEIDSRRAGLVITVDNWVSRRVASNPGAGLHTETIGTVIDRLAMAWTSVHRVLETDGSGSVVNGVWCRFAELADAYDELADEVSAGRRRLPQW